MVLTTPSVLVDLIEANQALVRGNIPNNEIAASWVLRTVNEDLGTQTSLNVTSGSDFGMSVFLSDLIAGTNYRVHVRAIDVFGVSSDEGTATFTTTGRTPPPPPPPTATKPLPPVISVFTEGITETTADLNWSPSSDGGSPITGYFLQFAEESQTIFGQNVGLITQFQMTGLTAGKSHTVILFAINDIGTSNGSNILSFSTLGTTTPPPIVTTDMITQSNGVWDLKDERITGEILFIATPQFNPFFHDKLILSIINIRDEFGNDIVTKLNDLSFTATERDERLFFDEFIPPEIDKVIIKSLVFVSETDISAFSLPLDFEVNRADPPMPPPPIGGKGNFFRLLPLAGIAALFINSARR